MVNCMLMYTKNINNETQLTGIFGGKISLSCIRITSTSTDLDVCTEDVDEA